MGAVVQHMQGYGQRPQRNITIPLTLMKFVTLIKLYPKRNPVNKMGHKNNYWILFHKYITTLQETLYPRHNYVANGWSTTAADFVNDRKVWCNSIFKITKNIYSAMEIILSVIHSNKQ